jgi:hypothetical protein
VVSTVTAAVHAELTKLRTLPRVWVVTAVVLAIQVLVLTQPMGLIARAVAGMTPDGTIEIFTGKPQQADTAILGLLRASSLQSGLFLPMVAAVVGGHEFPTGQLGLSALAVPRRGVLVTAKFVAVGLYLLVLSAVVAVLSTVFVYLSVRDWNPGLVVSGPAVLGQARFVAFAVLFSLTTLAITLLARSTLVGIAVTVVLVVLTMAQLLATAAPGVDVLLPMSAARNLLLDASVNTLNASPAQALVVLVAWAVVGTAAAGWTVARRSAR